MQRREVVTLPVALVVFVSAVLCNCSIAAEVGKPAGKKKVLYFTNGANGVHEVVVRAGGAPSYSERILSELGLKHGLEIIGTDDPAVIDGDLNQYDVIAFYTSGNPLSETGKKNLLAAIEAGKGFVGIHAASFTYVSDGIDPYIAMLGGEFFTHGSQQKASAKIVSPDFPGMDGLGDHLEMEEEWYASHKFAPDLHVILALDTSSLTEEPYQRATYPATWARMHGKGRVFYTCLGHRPDVWSNPKFQQILMGGITWAAGMADADVTPNINQVTPNANEFKK